MMGEWISVKDRLPDADGKYLVARRVFCSEGLVIDALYFAKNLADVSNMDFENRQRAGWYDFDSEIGHLEIYFVTHWMPLPPPPET